MSFQPGIKWTPVRQLSLLSRVIIAISLQALAQQTQPSAAEREEARRQGEEQSRQQREKEQQRLDGPMDPYRPRVYRVEGKVFMAGGGPPPDRVQVNAVCGGQVTIAKTLTNQEGRFSLQLGLSTGATDASARETTSGSAPHAGSQQPLSDCVLLAVLPGFRAEPFKVEVVPVRAVMILKPIENVSGYTFSATSLYASKDARGAQQKGSDALAKNKLDEAERELRRAVDLYPKYAVAWYDLGRVLMQKRNLQEARRAMEAAVAADPKYINPYLHLAQLSVNERRWEEVARHATTVIALNPLFSANIYVFSAQANLVLDHLDVAELHARRALEMDTDHRFPVTHRLLARILTKKGALNEAVEQLNLYLTHAPTGPEAETTKGEIATLEQQISSR